MFDMPFGCIEANDQIVCNLLVGGASGQEREHFSLTGAQGINERVMRGYLRRFGNSMLGG